MSFLCDLERYGGLVDWVLFCLEGRVMVGCSRKMTATYSQFLNYATKTTHAMRSLSYNRTCRRSRGCLRFSKANFRSEL